MSLTYILDNTRVRLTDVDLENLNPSNPNDVNDIKGRIAERLVYQWLKKCDISFDTDLPRREENLFLYQGSHGVHVTKDNLDVHEYDFMFYYQNQPFVAEVKSLKLNGAKAKIPRALELAKEIYQRPTKMLLFFPQYTNKQSFVKEIEEEFPLVTCVDSGYKRKQLNKTIKLYEDLTKIK